MSTNSATEQAKPNMNQTCNTCKNQGFPDQKIGFKKIGEDPSTGKIKWQLIDLDEHGNVRDHVHKGVAKSYGGGGYSKYKRIIDMAFVTDVVEARKLLALGWDFQTAFPTTIANIPTVVMVKKEA